MLCRENHFISINPRSGYLAGCDSRRSKGRTPSALTVKLLIKSKIQPKKNTRIMKTLHIIKFIVSHVPKSNWLLSVLVRWLARVPGRCLQQLGLSHCCSPVSGSFAHWSVAYRCEWSRFDLYQESHCCATKFVDWPDVKMLGCTMSRSIVSSKPVSTLEKDPVEKQPTEKPEKPAVGTDWVMVAENSHWAKMGWMYHVVGFTRRWGRDVATGWTAWWTGFFCRFWMIWMAQVLSSWCFSLVKPFSKVMIALICRKSFWLSFFYGGGLSFAKEPSKDSSKTACTPRLLLPWPLFHWLALAYLDSLRKWHSLCLWRNGRLAMECGFHFTSLHSSL